MKKNENQGDLFGHTDTTAYCQSKPKTASLKVSDLEREKQRYNEICAYRERMIELRANIRSFSDLSVKPSTVSLSDKYARVGESSPHAKYTDVELIHCFDLRLAGLSLREISRKMDIPVRTLRDIFSGNRRAVMPTQFK
jgi:hypothetical protein|uniref:InsA C-terminal domain n=1 Tax=Siphoviridae sp. ctRg81 TaxID=2826336 RepID=A0A8S5NHX0_9CAUD|nr:MAG TPA: InsA C-terminal domain [Siphoviridae sp. ctRg81]